MKQLNILVIEDEQRAGEKLIDSIKSITKNTQIEWTRNIKETIHFLKHKPKLDLIFSDIEL